MSRNGSHRRLLRPAKRRLLLRAAARAASSGLLGGLAAAVLAAALSFFVPVERLLFLVTTLPVGGAALGALAAALFLRPSDKKAARALDRLGAQERAVTMLELAGRNDDYAQLQRADAAANLPLIDTKRIPLSPPRWQIFACAGAAALVLLSFVLPNGQRDLLAQRAAEKQAIQKQAERIGAALGDRALDEAARAALKKLADGMKNAKTTSDAMKQLSKAEEQLKAQAEKQAADATRSLAAGLGQDEQTKPLADALQRGGSEAFRKNAADLVRALQQDKLTDGQKTGLQQALSAAAAALPSGALADALQGAARALASGTGGQAAQALDGALSAAAQAAAGQAGSAVDAQALLQQAKAQLGAASATLSNGNGQGSGNGNGNGQGNGQGQGSGNGNGGAGAGTGGGPDSEDESAGGTGSGHGGTQYAPGGERPAADYEAVYDPDRLGGQDAGSQVGGAQGEGPSDVVNAGPGQGTAGEKVPYNQVVHAYQSQAAQAMDRENIPAGLRDWVERYFASLTD